MSKIDRDNLDPGEDFELIARIHRCIMIGPFLLIAAAIYIMLQARGSEAFFWVGLLGITGFYYLSKAGDTCKDSLIAVTNRRIFVIYKGSPSFSCVIRFSDISSIVTVRNNYGSLFRQADIMITCVGSSTSYYLRHVKDAVVFRDMVRKYMRDADTAFGKQGL